MQSAVNNAPWSARRHIIIGLTAVAVLVFGLGGWSAFAKLSGAVIAHAELRVESRRKVVQHPDGGVIGKILVHEGDRVVAGQTLLILDDTALRANLGIIESQLFGLLARKARLAAERDDAHNLFFDPELVATAANSPEVARVVKGQKALFTARLETAAQEVEQLRGRISQIRDEIAGYQAQVDAKRRQEALVEQELDAQKTLYKRGHAPITRVLDLERSAAEFDGSIGKLKSSIAQAHGRISESELAIINRASSRREDAITQLREIEPKVSEARERRVTTLEKLSRTEIRAPDSGFVYGMTVHTEQGVARPAEPLMYIVPTNAKLVVDARVDPSNIDEINIGQKAAIRFPAFNARTTPEIMGVIRQISADRVDDEKTGASYYLAEISLSQSERAKIGKLHLVPGMPAVAFIKTHERTPMSYLIKPFTDNFEKAMREE